LLGGGVVVLSIRQNQLTIHGCPILWFLNTLLNSTTWLTRWFWIIHP